MRSENKDRLVFCMRRLVLVLVVFYAAGYLLARVGGVLVLRDYILKEEYVEIRRIGTGRVYGIGPHEKFRNRMNGWIYSFYRPLIAIEDSARGSRKDLTEPNKPLVTTAMTQTPSTTSIAPLSHL
jgi:hypothetical protein